MRVAPVRAVLWDFGGVILSSPFEAFNQYEEAHGLPHDHIRRVNATNPDANAWARFERSEIDAAAFDALFAEESAALGPRVPGSDVLALLGGTVRPQMVAALDAVIREGLLTACLTNNMVSHDHDDPGRRAQVGPVLSRFHHVVESSKVGCRKPEPRFYEIACALLGVSPDECVFLDDLGINLKPAAAMGMRTIKVGDPDLALAELSAHLGFDVAASLG